MGINKGPVSLADLMARKKAREEKPEYKARPIQPWQELAIEITKYLIGGMLARNKGSIFRCCKIDSHASRIAYEDMKEMYAANKDQKYLSTTYFFWMYNFIRSNYE